MGGFSWTKDGEHIQPRADSRYMLSIRSGQLFDGANVVLWSGYANPFMWVLDGQRVKLKVDTSLCLSIRSGQIGDGSDIILWRCGHTDEFLWNVVVTIFS